jgi:ribosomal protein L19
MKNSFVDVPVLSSLIAKNKKLKKHTKLHTKLKHKKNQKEIIEEITVTESMCETLEKYFPKGDKRRGEALVVNAVAVIEGRKQALKEFEGDLLRKSNHILGCMLEGYCNVLDVRGFNEEAKQMGEIASKIK